MNPDEDLRANPKQATAHNPTIRSKRELKRTVIRPMRRLTKAPERIRR
ncbi:hypothetical protein [Microvirga yunnanensis]|nr:hypothetical protein [Microvirga sp. HBU65207]